MRSVVMSMIDIAYLNLILSQILTENILYYNSRLQHHFSDCIISTKIVNKITDGTILFKFYVDDYLIKTCCK